MAFWRAATGESDLPLCGQGILGVPFESFQGNEAFSWIEGEVSVLSTCSRNRTVLLGFNREDRPPLEVLAESWDSSELGRRIGADFMMRWGKWGSFRVVA